MSYTFEDVYDIVLKWGTLYPIDNFNLIFMNNFTYENSDGIVKQTFTNSETLIKIFEKLITNHQWNSLIRLIKRLKKYHVNLENIYIPDVNDRVTRRMIRGGDGLYLSELLEYYLQYRWCCYYRFRNENFDDDDLFDINQLDYFVKLAIDLGVSDDFIIRVIENDIENYIDQCSDGWGYMFSELFEHQIKDLETVGNKYFMKFKYNQVMRELLYRPNDYIQEDD